MTEKTRVIFHIGLTKTGTTYLQNNVFPYLFKQYNYHGKAYSWNSFRKGFYCKNQNNFWSEEDSWMGGEDPRRFPYKRHQFWKSLDYLRNKVSDIRFILVLRHHEPWLKSLYLHDAKTKGRFWGFSLDQYVSYFESDYIKWSSHIDLLKDFDILLLNYEDLINRPEQFVKAICLFSYLEVEDYLIAKIISNNKNEKSGLVNLTPITQSEMIASRLFTKYSYSLSIINAIFKRLNIKKQLNRDLFIKLARKIPWQSSNVIENLCLQDDQLRQKFANDWEETWNKAKSLPNIKTLDDFF